MQRYYVKRIEARTYSIRDERDKKVYLLCVNPVSSPAANNQIIVAEVLQDDEFYVTFVKEVLNFVWWTSEWSQVKQTLNEFFAYLHNDGDLSNPTGQMLGVGTTLINGTTVTGPIDKKVIH